MQIACAHCLTRNRVPDARLADGPQCGHCHRPLLPAAPVAVSGNDIVRLVSGTELPVIADFWADWCGPCKVMAPQFAAAAAQLPHVRFAKVDTEAARETSAAYRIRSIPTIVLFRRGKEIARQAGAMSAADILLWVRPYL